MWANHCSTQMAAAIAFVPEAVPTGWTGECRISRKSRPPQESALAAFPRRQAMTVYGIEIDEQYRRALRTVSMLTSPNPVRGWPDGDRLMALIQLIGQYEATFMQDLAPAKPLVEPGQRNGQSRE